MNLNSKDERLFKNFLNYASEKHEGQFRKGKYKIPYITHPIAVSHIIAQAGVNDIRVHLAALGHDLLEDTTATVEEIRLHCDNDWVVASMIIDLSNLIPEGTPARQRLYNEQLQTSCREVHLIKMADMLHNLTCFSDREDLKTYGPIYADKKQATVDALAIGKLEQPIMYLSEDPDKIEGAYQKLRVEVLKKIEELKRMEKL